VLALAECSSPVHGGVLPLFAGRERQGAVLEPAVDDQVQIAAAWGVADEVALGHDNRRSAQCEVLLDKWRIGFGRRRAAAAFVGGLVRLDARRRWDDGDVQVAPVGLATPNVGLWAAQVGAVLALVHFPGPEDRSVLPLPVPREGQGAVSEPVVDHQVQVRAAAVNADEVTRNHNDGLGWDGEVLPDEGRVTASARRAAAAGVCLLVCGHACHCWDDGNVEITPLVLATPCIGVIRSQVRIVLALAHHASPEHRSVLPLAARRIRESAVLERVIDVEHEIAAAVGVADQVALHDDERAGSNEKVPGD